MGKDNYIRKPIVFNRKSAWHMEIYKRLNNESDNFSGYVISILKGHFDIKPSLIIPEEKVIKKEQPIEATQIVVKGKGIKILND